VNTYQTITSGVGPAVKTAEGLCGWQNGVVGSRCRLCSVARMYQMLMAGSAGEAAEGVVQPANAGASLGAQTVRDGGL